MLVEVSLQRAVYGRALTDHIIHSGWRGHFLKFAVSLARGTGRFLGCGEEVGRFLECGEEDGRYHAQWSAQCASASACVLYQGQNG